MEMKGFNEYEISEKSKENLRSETWCEVRKAMKTEIKHFVDELLKDDPYDYPWDRVVDEYLKNGYMKENTQYELTVLGSAYKVLRREEITTFYDADGNTLFDVTNERLEKEYEWLMNDAAGCTAESIDAGEENGEDEKGDSVVNRTEEDPEAGEAPLTERAGTEEEDIEDNGADDVIPMGTASLKEIVMGLPAPTAEEIAAAKEYNTKSVKQRAKEKLEKERESAKDSTFADPIIEYLLKRCNEDEGMAEDVVQEHKTWKKCFDYIYSQARKQAKGNCAAVRDDVVYEWAEDYYHKDDKAEEEKKAKEEAERKKREAARKKKAADQKSADKKNPKKTAAKEDKAEEKPVEPSKPKKNSKDMDGQMDLFSMMGI